MGPNVRKLKHHVISTRLARNDMKNQVPDFYARASSRTPRMGQEARFSPFKEQTSVCTFVALLNVEKPMRLQRLLNTSRCVSQAPEHHLHYPEHTQHYRFPHYCMQGVRDRFSNAISVRGIAKYRVMVERELCGNR